MTKFVWIEVHGYPIRPDANSADLISPEITQVKCEVLEEFPSSYLVKEIEGRFRGHSSIVRKSQIVRIETGAEFDDQT